MSSVFTLNEPCGRREYVLLRRQKQCKRSSAEQRQQTTDNKYSGRSVHMYHISTVNIFLVLSGVQCCEHFRYMGLKVLAIKSVHQWHNRFFMLGSDLSGPNNIDRTEY
jgi:hypothetical protein